MTEARYHIGVPDQPWGENERQQWLAEQEVKRSYKTEVLDKLHSIDSSFELEQYGVLSHNPERYPLFVVKSKALDTNKPTALITGGVHGYETSGVQGAVRFITAHAADYASRFNLVVAPCVSPWAYETINCTKPPTPITPSFAQH